MTEWEGRLLCLSTKADGGEGQGRPLLGASLPPPMTRPTDSSIHPTIPPDTPSTQQQASYVLYESASGYGLFEVVQHDDIASLTEEVGGWMDYLLLL